MTQTTNGNGQLDTANEPAFDTAIFNTMKYTSKLEYVNSVDWPNNTHGNDDIVIYQGDIEAYKYQKSDIFICSMNKSMKSLEGYKKMTALKHQVIRTQQNTETPSWDVTFDDVIVPLIRAGYRFLSRNSDGHVVLMSKLNLFQKLFKTWEKLVKAKKKQRTAD